MDAFERSNAESVQPFNVVNLKQNHDLYGIGHYKNQTRYCQSKQTAQAGEALTLKPEKR